MASPSPSPEVTPILYTLGSNSSGQLGIGHTNDVNTPQKCIFEVDKQLISPKWYRGSGWDIQKIATGGNHTLVLIESGRLFVAGAIGLLGCDGKEWLESSNVFKDITNLVQCASIRGSNEPITDIAATWEASLIVIDKKSILCWGAGTKGELGLNRNPFTNGQIESLNCRFDRHDSNIEITGIHTGIAHVVVTVSNGDLWGWGSSRNGQLGEHFATRKVLWEASRLDVGSTLSSLPPPKPEKVILGRDYTMFLKAGEKPVVWGEKNLFKKTDFDWVLGHDDEVVPGWSSVHFLWRKSTLGAVSTIGKNNHGQFAPKNLPPVRALAAGSEHCVALTAAGQVITWGWGEHGNCGAKVDEKGNVVDRWNVIPMAELEEGAIVKNVAAGCATTFVVCSKVED